MIPHRIQLAGFLSYKEEQEIDFGSAPLWMLAGTNGSGKSSIFDGVTYALFGTHRGGTQNAGELINKDSNALSVEFDFRLDKLTFRAKRTYRRSPKGAFSGTQQLFQQLNDGTWEAVADTNKKVDFDRWIQQKIGLNYETFTSSVLLLQGKAEKLLDANPKGRAEVLAGIVDLERYQRLHERANDRKIGLKNQLDALSHQTAAVPEVSDEDHTAAILRIAADEGTRDDAVRLIEDLQARETQAHRWVDAQARLAGARAKLAGAEAILDETDAIEKSFARLQELQAVLPAVHTVVRMKGNLAESERRTEERVKHRTEAQERKTRLEHTQEQGKKKRAALQKTLADDEAKAAKVVARLRELGGKLEVARQLDDQQAQAKAIQADLARLGPDDFEAVVAQHAARVEELSELARVLPILERFTTERHELTAAQRSRAEAAAALQEVEKSGKTLRDAEKAAKAAAEEAATAKAEADRNLAQAELQAQQAKQAARDLATPDASGTCQACGQPLTPAHLAAEKGRREKALAAADKSLKASRKLQEQAAAAAAEKAEAVRTLALELAELRDAYTTRQSQQKHAAADADRLAKALAVRYAELPESFQLLIAPEPPHDWTATSYPNRDELIAPRREVAQLETVRAKVRDAQTKLGRWSQLNTKLEGAREGVARLQKGLGGIDPAEIRRESQGLQAEESALTSSIKTAKQGLAALETEADKVARELHDCVFTITDLQGRLTTEEANRANYQDSIATATRLLPPAWQAAVQSARMGEHAAWKMELEKLERDQTESKYRSLDLARAGVANLRADIATAQTAVDAFPDAHRVTPEAVRTQLAAARVALETAERDVRLATQHLARLEGYREQRVKLGARFVELDSQHNRYKILSELLGRDRLQRHLVRQAERQIVEYANGVLDRLSGGQLYLKLIGGEDSTGNDRTLDLECANRVTGGSPIHVAFLSGSQKFRVAVALALAIGQYASRQHRPIESVIIDEGFGCLDRQGRQVMIQELQNLRGHLHCILLVSHQEEFADAFPDGYRFELQNGATKVSRFRR